MAKKKTQPKKKPVVKRKVGAPSTYTEAMGKKICDAIAKTEKGLHRLFKEHPDFPNVSTIFDWLEVHPEFAKRYARAKREQAQLFAESIIEIADDDSKDLLAIDDYGNRIENKEFVNRSKLRIDARKWAAAHLDPKKWGDKLDITSDNEKIQNVVPLTADVVKAIADGLGSKI